MFSSKFKFLMLIAAAALAFSGCAKDGSTLKPNKETKDQKQEIIIPSAASCGCGVVK